MRAMHAFYGYALGDNTVKRRGMLTLNPIRHIDPVMTIYSLIMVILHAQFSEAKPVPFNPFESVWRLGSYLLLFCPLI